MFLSFPRYRRFIYIFLLRFKMSAHQMNKDKPRSSKCQHFCFAFDAHNYCSTCRESGKGDDPCVTFKAPCEICASFTEKLHTENARLRSKRRTLLVQKTMNSIF